MSSDTKVEVKTRDWIAKAKAEAQANVDRHKAALKKNWSGRCSDCTACKVHENGARTICEPHLEEFRDKIPCEACGVPVEGPDEWEHALCGSCVAIAGLIYPGMKRDTDVRDFLEYERARVLVAGEVKQVRAMRDLAQHRRRDAEQALAAQTRANVGLSKRFLELSKQIGVLKTAAGAIDRIRWIAGSSDSSKTGYDALAVIKEICDEVSPAKAKQASE